MKIDKLLKDCAASINALSNRLEIQNRACHNPSDKADVAEWIDDCQKQVEALQVIASAYAPILQSAIDTGLQGHTHKIVVYSRINETTKFECDLDDHKNYAVVSEHEFTVS